MRLIFGWSRTRERPARDRSGGDAGERRDHGHRAIKRITATPRTSLPRIVGAEAPEMTLKVVTRIAAPAMIIVTELEDDLSTCRLGPQIVRVGIVDDEVAALRF